jgi:hypothetical protein
MDLATQKQILTNLKDIIEVAQSRGCWKVNEMKPVGETYTNLCQLIKEVDETLNAEQVEKVEESVEEVKTI